MESSYSTSPCSRDCKNRCVEPNCHMTCEAYLNWRKNVDRQREAATEYRANRWAKRRESNKRKRLLDFIVDILKGEHHVSFLPILRRCSDSSIFASAIRGVCESEIRILSRLLGRMPEM